MDPLALLTLCSVMFDPGVMHALVVAEREDNPRSFRGVDDVLRSLARTAVVMRVPEAEMTAVRVDLADLAVDPEAASAQPIEGVLESCPSVVLAILHLAQRAETCRPRYSSTPVERCAPAAHHANF